MLKNVNFTLNVYERKFIYVLSFTYMYKTNNKNYYLRIRSS